MTRFRIGSHEVQVWREIGGWVVSVDQRTHRHRYFGVLAPNSPLRPAVTALARDAAVKPAQVQAGWQQRLTVVLPTLRGSAAPVTAKNGSYRKISGNWL